MSDLLPETDGLFLGNDSRRWDGSKLTDLPGGRTLMGGFVKLQCTGFPFEDQYSLLGCGIGGVSTNMPLAQQTPIVAGKFTKMKVRVTSLNDFTNEIAVTLRKNGEATNAAVTIVASAVNTTYVWAGEVSVAENDVVDLHYNVAGAGGWELAYLTMVFEFQPS